MRRFSMTPVQASGLAFAAAVFALGPSDAFAQDGHPLVGDWVGTLIAGPQQLQIVYHIVEGADGALTGTMDVPAQGATGIPLTTVVLEDGAVSMTFPVPGGGSYEGTVDETGDIVAGTFTQGGQPFPMDLARTDEAPGAPARPQEPQEPFPYSVEEVTFVNHEAGVTLAGTLTMPEGPGPFPAAVLVSGSGPQDRNESLLGHKPFLVLADHLTRNGVAVLRYDDRGVAESSGDFSIATSEDFAADALAGLAYVSENARVKAGAVGIVGHSEGGLIGPLAASRSESVDYVVMLAGPGVPGIDILVEQGRLINAAGGQAQGMTDFNARIQIRLAEVVRDQSDTEAAATAMRAAIHEEIAALDPDLASTVREAFGADAIEQAIVQINSPWFRHFLQYDPRPALEKTAVPVLALFGEKDLQVPPRQSSEEVKMALERGGNPDATVRVLPGLNHLFQEADTGSPAEYQQIEQTFSPMALSEVSEWIVRRFGVRGT